MTWFTGLSLYAQTAYGQLFEAAADDRVVAFGLGPARLVREEDGQGRDYSYLQFSDLAGTLKHLYVGPGEEEPIRGTIRFCCGPWLL
jgi:hypothetical protein